ncbi:MAG: DcaP family trimeric outer membrane transporter [Pseudomonadota bacterium]
MTCSILGRVFRGALLGGSMLSWAVTGAAAQSVEDRVGRLEALLESVLQRLEAQDARISAEDAKVIAETQKAVAQVKAVEAKMDEAAASAPAPANGFKIGNTTVNFGGYIKLDTMATRFSGGEFPSVSFLRDFLVPGAIPVGGRGDGWDLDYSARQTRFNFKFDTDLGNEHKLGGYMELDFQVTSADGVDERVSNSYNPRMRHAFLTFDNWLFGQTWSTFLNVSAFPDVLDFIGPTSGIIFIRQPQIRYTKGGFQVAIEQPEATLSAYGTGARLISGDDPMPDLVLRYNAKGDWGEVSLAGIARNLHVEPGLSTVSEADTALGYGVNLSGKINVGAADDIRFAVTAGEGLGRYIGLNIVNAAAITNVGTLDAIATYSGFVAYRHPWTKTWRSTFSIAGFKADNPIAFTGLGVTDTVWNALANIIVSPVPKLDLGLEYMFAKRQLESGLSGTMNRVQFSAIYKF